MKILVYVAAGDGKGRAGEVEGRGVPGVRGAETSLLPQRRCVGSWMEALAAGEVVEGGGVSGRPGGEWSGGRDSARRTTCSRQGDATRRPPAPVASTCGGWMEAVAAGEVVVGRGSGRAG